MNLKRVKNGIALFFAAAMMILIGCPGAGPETGTETETTDPNKLVITFDLGGAEGTPPGSITLTIDPEYGDAMADEFPENPSWTGYVFAGWYDGETKYSDSSVFKIGRAHV